MYYRHVRQWRIFSLYHILLSYIASELYANLSDVLLYYTVSDGKDVSHYVIRHSDFYILQVYSASEMFTDVFLPSVPDTVHL